MNEPNSRMNLQRDVHVIAVEEPFGMDTSDVVEVPLLLAGWQMSALERAAYLRGLTAAEMVRQLLRDFIDDQPTSC